MRIVLALVLASAAAPALAGPASDAVQFFYSNIGAEFDPANRNRFMDPAKAVFDATEKLGEPCIGFAVAIDAQNYDEAELARTLRLVEEVNGDQAMVTASFSLYPGDPENDREIVWELKQVGGQWKIFDIGQANGAWRLSEVSCE
jgi:hypothetical protein